jgi:alkanesulfonate monooxygenase SsuD/methylene tetrahydromethanopterin reductase-like flavin-dependent oxidoreductase (luciferase family)
LARESADCSSRWLTDLFRSRLTVQRAERFSSRYPYSRGENIPIPTDTPLLNPFLALTYAAARTNRIRLATGICLVPEYNPVLLAKICATLDLASFAAQASWI